MGQPMYFKAWEMVFCDQLRSSVLMLLNLDALANLRYHTFFGRVQVIRDYTLCFAIKRV
jgi:hypothetical protein